MAVLVGSANADVILIDFGNTSGTTVGNWNNSNVSGYTLTNMIDTDGNATVYDLFFNTSVGQGGNWGVTAAPAPFNVSSAYNDGLFTAADTITFTLSGLLATETYDLTMFASRDAAGTRITDYTVTGSGAPVTLSLQTSGTGLGGVGINHNIANTVNFSGIAPDVNNQISVSIDINSGGFAYLNAMQITVVPEPASLSLLLLGGFLLSVIRRGKQAVA
jgi:hypothetical protein